MPFTTPKFWYAPRGIISYALLPVAWVYQLFHCLNQSLKPKAYQSSIPIICIGNAVAGGSGKTPTAMALMKLIIATGGFKSPCFLTRGYGGDIQYSDEAELLKKIAPTIIAANRAAGAKSAEQQKHDLIIMDDGLMNKALKKDITFLVIDRAVDFGNGMTIPAGPLREPLSKILPKSDAVICIGEILLSDKPVFAAQIKPTVTLPKDKYIAFAGLGRPEKFLETLVNLDVEVIGWHEFADHHPYSNADIENLATLAKAQNAKLITTEKDFARIPEKYKSEIMVLPIELEFFASDEIINYIKTTLKS